MPSRVFYLEQIMATNERMYQAALTEWDALNAAGSLSVPATDGITALLLPFNHTYRDSENLEGQNFSDLCDATYRLADQAMAQGRDIELAINATAVDFDRVLTDHTISDVIVIGHGCLASIEMTSVHDTDRIDWRDVAYYANHLKTGKFVQLTCGTLPRKLNVPFGLFAVSAHHNVLAAVGERIVPAYFWRVDSPIAPVTSKSRLDLESVKELFPQRKLTITQEVHVALGGLKQVLLERMAVLTQVDAK